MKSLILYIYYEQEFSDFVDKPSKYQFEYYYIFSEFLTTFCFWNISSWKDKL